MVLLHAIFLIDGIKECEAIFVRLKQYIFFLALALLHGQWLWLLAFYYYL
jgi:hypothetical protein